MPDDASKIPVLNSVCDQHGHDAGLPAEPLRAHVLAIAIRAAEQALAAHGYPDRERATEVIHVALEDSLDDGATETMTQ